MDPRPPRKYAVVFDRISTVKPGDMVVCPSSGCWVTVANVETSDAGKVDLTWGASKPVGCDGFVGAPGLVLAIRRSTAVRD